MRQDILFVTFNKEKGKVNMFEIKLFSILGNWEPGLFSNFDLSTTIDTTGDRNIFALSFFHESLSMEVFDGPDINDLFSQKR